LILYNLAGVLSALRSVHACLLAIVRLLLRSSSVSLSGFLDGCSHIEDGRWKII
jgi:hypothetical protein